MLRPMLIATALMTAAGPVADEIAVANVFLITHSEATIDASPEAIWPYILDTSEWKTLSTSTHYSGEPDREGEKRLIRGGSGDTAYQFYTETVELIPHKRKVIAIYFDQAGAGDIGYAAWTLFERGGNTLVTYDVNHVYRTPGLADDEIAAATGDVTKPNQERFDRELLVLKALVENNRF